MYDLLGYGIFINDLANRCVLLSVDLCLTYNAEGLFAMNETKIQICQPTRTGRVSPFIINMATEGCLENITG